MEMETVGEPRVAPSGWRNDPSRYLTGIAYLLVVVLLWTASNFLTSALESGPDGYDKPFFITYLNTTTFTLYLVPSLLAHRRDARKPQYEPLSSNEPDTLAPRPVDDSTKQHPLPRLTLRETAVVSVWWSIGWFMANFMINLALAMTSVASATILSATSGFFTLVLGSLCGVEKPTRTNVSSVFFSFLGVVLITRSDSTHFDDPTAALTSHPILGDLAAIISALCYSGYVVLLKVKLVDESRADSRLMLGFAGLYQTLALIPIFPILHATGWECFQMPPNRRAWSICAANMGVTLVSDYLYILAMLKTSPMLVTVGLSMTIPLTLLVSIVFPSLASGSITLLSLLGAGMVLGAFVLLSWRGKDEETSPIESLEEY